MATNLRSRSAGIQKDAISAPKSDPSINEAIGTIDLDAGLQSGAWDAVANGIPDANTEDFSWKFKVPIERMTPKARPGYVQQWIRVQTADGRPDVANKAEALQIGWRPRRQSTLSENERSIPVYDPGDGKGGVIVFGGQLLLCEMPVELWTRRNKALFAEQARIKDAIYKQPQERSGMNPKYGRVSFENPRDSDALVD